MFRVDAAYAYFTPCYFRLFIFAASYAERHALLPGVIQRFCLAMLLLLLFDA